MGSFGQVIPAPHIIPKSPVSCWWESNTWFLMCIRLVTQLWIRVSVGSEHTQRWMLTELDLSKHKVQELLHLVCPALCRGRLDPGTSKMSHLLARPKKKVWSPYFPSFQVWSVLEKSEVFDRVLYLQRGILFWTSFKYFVGRSISSFGVVHVFW